MNVSLRDYDNSWYKPGPLFKRVLWYVISALFFKTVVPYPSRMKVALLRFFGAEVGVGVVIKPELHIKYPWFLRVGSHVWLGEKVWIDNLARVSIGDDAVLSQGAYILTGSHDYGEERFSLVLGEVVIERGVWIAAKSIVCPGVRCARQSVLTVGSVATQDLQANSVYQGNPAVSKTVRFTADSGDHSEAAASSADA